MPAGQKTLTVNTLERAVSSDINRLQLFQAAATSELMRAMVNTNFGVDDIQASSFNSQNTGTASPESLDVYNGLVVRPIGSTLTCSIDPGVAGVIFPDSDPDSSPYKLVQDPGVPSGSAITIPPNSSGSIRIDVIECTFVLNANSETDNRDIFNPATGAFVATTVPKASQGTFQYQLRSGTGGSGFPGTINGWTPLCVIATPSGATSVSNCTFWDVRPLVADRVIPPYNLQQLFPSARKNKWCIDTLTTSGKAFPSGYFDTTATDPGILSGTGLGGNYRLGGFCSAMLDFNDAGNQAGTMSGSIAYFYVMEPFGLPRWAQYTASGGGGALAPANPRGILTVSSVAPDGPIGAPAGGLPMPTNTGLGGTCTKAVCIGVTHFASSVLSSVVTDGVTQSCSTTPWPLMSTSGTSFVMVPGTHYPAFASAIWVTLTFQGTVNNGLNGLIGGTFDICDPTGAHVYASTAMPPFTFPNGTGSPQVLQTGQRIKVPVALVTQIGGFMLRWTQTISNITELDITAQCDAWDLV